MERNLISLPCGATFTLLVSDDVEFLHGKLLPFAPDKAEEAVSAYQELAIGSKGIAGIGYEISFNDSKMEDKLHFFYPGEPEYEDGAMNGLCYREVRRAVERVIARASVKEFAVGDRLFKPLASGEAKEVFVSAIRGGALEIRETLPDGSFGTKEYPIHLCNGAEYIDWGKWDDTKHISIAPGFWRAKDKN